MARSASPPTATTDPDAAAEELSGDEFVFDVQTHLLDFDLSGDRDQEFGSGFPYANCGEADWHDCFGVDHWLEELFVRSDTTMAVVSAVPILAARNPLSIEVMEAARRSGFTRAAETDRVFLHGQVNPNVGDPEAAFDGMRRLAAEHPIAAWKVYTHVPDDRGWFLDDHDPDGVQCGQRFLDVVREVGPKVVCVHKGLGDNSPWSSPVDIGPAAKANPDIQFVVYHSGYEGAEGSVHRGDCGRRDQPAARLDRNGRDRTRRERVRRAGNDLVERDARPDPGRARRGQAACRASARHACAGERIRSGTARRKIRSRRSERSRSPSSSKRNTGTPRSPTS